MRISREKVGFAGTKDKRAVTTQRMSFECEPSKLDLVELEDIQINNVFRSDRPVRMGDLKGNRFTINVRDTDTGPEATKDTVSKILAHKFRVVDIHSYAEEHGLFEEYDEEAGSYDVDVEKLNDSILSERFPEEYVFLDGHLSHFVDCDIIIVLRCDPRKLSERLKARGYDERKVLENVQAEVLDVILG